MASKFVYPKIVRRMISSYGIDKIVIRVGDAVTYLGKTLRAHIMMDRGLGKEVPVYWSDEPKRIKIKATQGRIDVKSSVNI